MRVAAAIEDATRMWGAPCCIPSSVLDSDDHAVLGHPVPDGPAEESTSASTAATRGHLA